MAEKTNNKIQDDVKRQMEAYPENWLMTFCEKK